MRFDGRVRRFPENFRLKLFTIEWNRQHFAEFPVKTKLSAYFSTTYGILDSGGNLESS